MGRSSTSWRASSRTISGSELKPTGVLVPLASRVRQGVAALRPRVPTDRDAILAAVLSPEQAAAFRSLPVHDQAHLCRVYRALRGEGIEDRDVLAAALLHDLGKAHPRRGRVRLPDRVARVVLGRVAPGFLQRLSRWPAPAWRRGLALAVHHPAIGAKRAARLGCSDRTCWLIAHHEDDPLPEDAFLRRLATADHECA